jgi:hypothetical protein
MHRRRDGDVLLSLSEIAHAVMHLTETEAANERAHAAWLRECQCLAVVPFSMFTAAMLKMGRDIT